MDRDSWEMDRSTIPDSPDTEPSDPPGTSATPVPDTDTVDISVTMESSVVPKTPRTVRDPVRSLAQTARSAEHSRAPHEPEQNSHTTMQSMMKPDVKMSGVPHSRRFLSIENDLDQMSAAVRLLEKNLVSAQKEARIAWILATVALVFAALMATL